MMLPLCHDRAAAQQVVQLYTHTVHCCRVEPYVEPALKIMCLGKSQLVAVS